MEKYATVVTQKALSDEVFEQKDGIPILACFEEMRALLRKVQKVWKTDPVMQGKMPQWVPKSSGNAGGGAGNKNGGGSGKQATCRVCKPKTRKTKDYSSRACKSCQLWMDKGECSFGEECVHEHKAAEKGKTNNSSGNSSGAGAMPGKPAWINPTGAPD
jgi:hypothetical protein